MVMTYQESNIYNIIEVANTHGGSLEYVLSLIDEFSNISEDRIGIKFQPFSADGIAHKDYDLYKLYQELEFSNDDWEKMISRAVKYFDVWLDMFDEYSVEILKKNIKNIKGIKLQSSTLKNYRLRYALKNTNISDKKIIVNVAGYNVEFTREIISDLSEELNPKELILQVGFQDYPTAVEDCGLHKISALQNIFSGNICFADHTDGKSNDAILLPMLAIGKGCRYIEKHIMHSTLVTKYDASSSVTFRIFKKILKHQADYRKIFESSYLTEKEKLYLEKTYQMPIARSNLVAGQRLNLYEDLDYKRTQYYHFECFELPDTVQCHFLVY